MVYGNKQWIIIVEINYEPLLCTVCS